jgi:hypothetical protein
VRIRAVRGVLQRKGQSPLGDRLRQAVTPSSGVAGGGPGDLALKLKGMIDAGDRPLALSRSSASSCLKRPTRARFRPPDMVSSILWTRTTRRTVDRTTAGPRSPFSQTSTRLSGVPTVQ